MSHGFIGGLLEAAKIYFSSRNIASFNLVDFIRVLKSVYKCVCTRSECKAGDVHKLLGGSVNPRDVSGYLSLAWHLDLVACSLGRGGYVYRATAATRNVVQKCENPLSRECVMFLKNIFVRWEPLRVLLRFFKSVGGERWRDAVRVLGGEMRVWNMRLYKLFSLDTRIRNPIKLAGRKYPAKPYNDYVVRKLFKPLIEQLEIYPEDVEDVSPFIKGRWGEPIIAAGVADIVYSSRTINVITPFVDEVGIKLIINAAALNPRPRTLLLIARRRCLDRMGSKLERLKKIGKDVGLDLDPRGKGEAIHAKMYVGNGKVLMTSANLTYTSLMRNLEFGIILYRMDPSVESIVYSLL